MWVLLALPPVAYHGPCSVGVGRQCGGTERDKRVLETIRHPPPALSSSHLETDAKNKRRMCGRRQGTPRMTPGCPFPALVAPLSTVSAAFHLVVGTRTAAKGRKTRKQNTKPLFGCSQGSRSPWPQRSRGQDLQAPGGPGGGPQKPPSSSGFPPLA